MKCLGCHREILPLSVAELIKSLVNKLLYNFFIEIIVKEENPIYCGNFNEEMV